MTQGRRVYHWDFSVNRNIGVGIDRDCEYEYDSRFADNDKGRDRRSRGNQRLREHIAPDL